MKLFLTIFLAIQILFSSGQFKKQEVLATLEGSMLAEASGLDQSYQNPGFFWSHNDSGGQPVVYLIDTSGEVQMEVRLLGTVNRDWEEIITVRESGGSYIYIAETGDNRAQYQDIKLIRIKEPKFTGQGKMEISEDKQEIMSFQYQEGPRDAEATFYDYNSERFVLITKREEQSMVYSFSFDPGANVKSIVSLGTIPDRNFTSADMNEEGEILLKTYDKIYFFQKTQENAAKKVLAWDPTILNYTPEPQGEAICWFEDDFYTVSEKNRGHDQELLIFEREK